MSKLPHDDDTHHLVRDRSALTAQEKLEAIVLTPPMVQAAALMYIMLANGELAAVPGGPGSPKRPMMSPLLQTVRDYVDGIPFERFLMDGPPILSVKERLGVLVSTYDAMLVGGEPQEAERIRFDKLTVAFGIKPEALETFRQAISAKNNRASLGKFDSQNLNIHAPTPHVGLAAALVHSMMSPDGSIHAEDMDRLEGVIGEYEGLLQFALNDAASVKPERLFETMSKVLTGDQKLFVLTNVLDTMFRDGEVEAPESKSIFQSMRSVLGFTENAFKPFISALKIKSTKSAASHDRFGGSILRGIRANFEKKPVGYGKQLAEEAAAAAASNMQKVNRIAIPDQDQTLVNSEGLVIANGAAGSQFVGGANSDSHTGNASGAAKTGDASANASATGAARGARRNSQELSALEIQAQAKLTTARKQLESTRAVNAEIRALLDQPQRPLGKSSRRKTSHAPKPLGASANHRPMAQPAASNLRAAVGAFQVQQQKIIAAPLNQAIKKLQEMGATPGNPKGGLRIASFFEPDNLWRVLPVAAALAGILAGPALGYLRENVPAHAAEPISCWFDVPFFKPSHTPYSSLGCWSSPRVRAAKQGNVHIPVLGRPVEDTISAL